MEIGRGADELSASRHRECALCLEKFKSPRILPCFHTLCITCLEQLIKTQPRRGVGFPCPTCRQMTPIPPMGVGQFQVNFYIEAEMEALNLQSSTHVINCDMCGGVPVTHKCSDCNQFACSPCMEIHATIAATRNHTVLNLDSPKKDGNKDTLVIKERFCRVHSGEKVRFYCSVCNCVICRDCKLTSHEGHKTTDLSQKAVEAKKILTAVTHKSRQFLQPLLLQVLEEAENLQQEVETQRLEILKIFQQRADELRLAVDSCLKNAESKLCMAVDDVEKTISESIQEMKQQLTCFVSLMEHVESVTNTGSDADILDLPTQIHEFFGKTENVTKLPRTQNPVMSMGKGVVAPCRRNAFHLKIRQFSGDDNNLLYKDYFGYKCGDEPSYQDGSNEQMTLRQQLAYQDSFPRESKSMTTNEAIQHAPDPVSLCQHLKMFTDANWRIGISFANFNQNSQNKSLSQDEVQYPQTLHGQNSVKFQNKIPTDYSTSHSVLHALTNQMAAYIGDVQKSININHVSDFGENPIMAPRIQNEHKNVSQYNDAQILRHVADINNIILKWMRES